MTETKPAPGWCLQRLWGRSFGVLRGFNVSVQLLRENQALLGFFWKGTRALETTGAGAPAQPLPGFLPRGSSGRRHNRERGTGAASGPVDYSSRQAPRMRDSGAEVGGARDVCPAPPAPAAILSPTFTRRPTGRFFFS